MIRDLLTDDHGHWDIGYVSLAFLMAMILGVIPIMLCLVIWRFYIEPGHPLELLAVGQAIGLVTAAFGSPLAALAAYIMAVKRPTAPLPPGSPPAPTPPDQAYG